MDFWWRVSGYAVLELTSGDWPARLLHLAQMGLRLEQIQTLDDLTVRFCVRSGEVKQVQTALARWGEEAQVLSVGGLPQALRRWVRCPIILLTLALLTAATIWLPGRILWIQVEGNGQVPQRQILEAAAQYGVCFGAQRRQVRSEQVKNALLEQIPELSWVGVNTSGCRAVIRVRARDEAQQTERPVTAGAVVAVRDAVVTEVTVTGGTGLCAPGESVQVGDVLISGITDLGICTRAEAAEGEIWGLTNRSICVVVPDTLLHSEPTGEIVEKYSLLLGKKRINFYSDSGILYGTCGKMREVIWLTLPGGWELPAALVIERYELTQCTPSSRQDAQNLLTQTAKRSVTADMIAGQIRSTSVDVVPEGALWMLRGEYECHEMIGRLRPGVYLEGDTNDDRENGQRGAG